MRHGAGPRILTFIGPPQLVRPLTMKGFLMTYFVRLVALATLGTVSLPAATFAQQQCAKRDQVLERLTSKYGEVRQSIGLAPNNGVFEVYASKDTGSWTILVTGVDGMSCMIASGQAFETLAGNAAPAGDDA